MRILILGAPGVGKSTDAKILSKKLRLPIIYIGKLLREEIDKGSELGKKIAPIINKGKLVSKEIVDYVLTRRLSKIDCRKGYIIDGFPRKLDEAKWFTKKHAPERVLYFTADEDIAIKRINGRKDNRSDQSTKTIRTRFRVYHKKTEPVIKYFKRKRLIYIIDANPPINKVIEKAMDAIKYGNK